MLAIQCLHFEKLVNEIQKNITYMLSFYVLIAYTTMNKIAFFLNCLEGEHIFYLYIAVCATVICVDGF